MRSLKVKILIPVLLVSVAAFILTSFSFYLTSKASLEKTVESESGMVVQEKAEEINSWLSGFSRILETLSEANLVSGVDEKKEQEVLAALIKKNSQIQDIYVGLEADGRFIDGTGWIPDAGWDPRSRG